MNSAAIIAVLFPPKNHLKLSFIYSVNADGIDGCVNCTGEAGLADEGRHHSSVLQFTLSWENVKCSRVTGNVIKSSLIFQQVCVRYWRALFCWFPASFQLQTRDWVAAIASALCGWAEVEQLIANTGPQEIFFYCYLSSLFQLVR